MKRTSPTQKVRDSVFGRDCSCVICGETYQLQIHHRRPRGSGGTSRPESNQPANLLLVCLEHHAWIESNRDTARQSGYLVPQHIDPENVLLVWHGAWAFLCNDGTVHRIAGSCPIPGWDGCTDDTPCPACPSLATGPIPDQRSGGEQGIA